VKLRRQTRRFRNGSGDKACLLPVCCASAKQGPAGREATQEAFMAARSIASLSLSFGLVSIPVKLYSATESSATVRFNMLAKDGSRLKQQYVSEKDQSVVERAEMVKGYEFEKDRFVIFSPEELKAVQESPSHSVDIVAFIPDKAIDPIFYDKAYFLAPDKRGAKPYNLLMEAMRQSSRVALAKWAWKGKQYVVQVRPAEEGIVLQQLLYADEVRSMKELDIEKVTVSPAELKLAMQLIDQISEDTYDPTMFEDEEKKRILAAIDEKIAGKQVVANEPVEPASGAQVIDLMEALRASLGAKGGAKAKAAPAKAAPAAEPAPAVEATKERKGVKRAQKAEEPAAPARARAKK
jgi:DNA end-binding protein Ku